MPALRRKGASRRFPSSSRQLIAACGDDSATQQSRRTDADPGHWRRCRRALASGTEAARALRRLATLAAAAVLRRPARTPVLGRRLDLRHARSGRATPTTSPAAARSPSPTPTSSRRAPRPARTARSTSPPSPTTPSVCGEVDVCIDAPDSPVYDDATCCQMLRQLTARRTASSPPPCVALPAGVDNPPPSLPFCNDARHRLRRRRRVGVAGDPGGGRRGVRSQRRLHVHQLHRLRAHARAAVGRHLHRNVIFRNEHVPPFATSQLETARRRCRRDRGRRSRRPLPERRHWLRCDDHPAQLQPQRAALQFFDPGRRDRSAARARTASRSSRSTRARQTRMPLRPPAPAAASAPRTSSAPSSRSRMRPRCPASGRRRSTSTRRATWCNTLERRRCTLEESLGVNPFRFGFVGEHRHAQLDAPATPRSATERQRAATTTRTPGAPRSAAACVTEPGGLGGVWAEENSRDALFTALRSPRDLRHQRHAAGGALLRRRRSPDVRLRARSTSSPAAYQTGNALMGGEIGAVQRRARASPCSRLADPGTAELPAPIFRRIQIVSRLVAQDGTPRDRAYDVGRRCQQRR